MTTPAPHVARMIDEAAQLNDRLVKLRNFMTQNPIFLTQSKDEQLLMTDQMIHMDNYLCILRERIKLATQGAQA
jgi:hypothetical protein